MSFPASFPQPPQATDYGGPVLASPKLVPVFFSNDDATRVAALTDFENKVGATNYWTATTSEYGVGPATALAPVMLTEAAPSTIDDATIQTWLAGKLNGNDPAWPVNDANTVYVLHYPVSTTVTAQGSTSCTDFGGYHSNITLDQNHGNADAAYVVAVECDGFDNLTGIDAATGATSHELIEAVTDPYPNDNPAYALVDEAHLFWVRVLGGGEVGDLCAQFPGVFVQFPELAYTVQRTWSNAAANAGHDPCVPELSGEVYFNAAPNLPDMVTISFMGQNITETGVQIPVGSSRTIDVDLFSEAATSGPWTVEAKDTASLFGQTPNLSFSWDRTTGQNGDILHLTITVNAANTRNRETFLVHSSLGTDDTYWIGLVTN